MSPFPRGAAALCLVLAAAPAPALGPADVYLVVNKNVPASRELAEHYRKVRGVSGATIMGDGSVALILDVGLLVRGAHASAASSSAAAHRQTGEAAAAAAC